MLMTMGNLLKMSFSKIVLPICLLSMFCVSASYAADPGKGSSIYSKNCTSCHDASGGGVMPGVPDFSQGDTLFRSDLELLNSIQEGKSMMPAYRGILSNMEILDVIAYLRTLN